MRRADREADWRIGPCGRQIFSRHPPPCTREQAVTLAHLPHILVPPGTGCRPVADPPLECELDIEKAMLDVTERSMTNTTVSLPAARDLDSSRARERQHHRADHEPERLEGQVA